MRQRACMDIREIATSAKVRLATMGKRERRLRRSVVAAAFVCSVACRGDRYGQGAASGVLRFGEDDADGSYSTDEKGYEHA